MREISDYIKAINKRDKILDKASICLEEFMLGKDNVDGIEELNKLLEEINTFINR